MKQTEIGMGSLIGKSLCRPCGGSSCRLEEFRLHCHLGRGMDKLLCRCSNISLLLQLRLTTILQLRPTNHSPQSNSPHTSSRANPKVSKPSKSLSRSAAKPVAKASPPQTQSTAPQHNTPSTTSAQHATVLPQRRRSSSQQAKISRSVNARRWAAAGAGRTSRKARWYGTAINAGIKIYVRSVGGRPRSSANMLLQGRSP